MNKKKGFSLVEVLAVIVVLAIIALIAVPLVGNQIESSRKAAFKDSVLEASKGLNIYLNRKQIKMTPGIEDGAGVSIETLKKEDLISKLISGRFVEIDDKVYAYFISDGNYCAYGPIDDLTVSKECGDLDPTAPIIEKDAFRLSSTTNSITVTVDEKKIYDNDFNDVTYTLNVYLKSKKIKSQKQIDGQNIYTFEGLKENTEYSVELVATNRAMKQSKQSKKISTFALKKPDFVVEPEGYAFQKNITIKYHNDNITNPKYYFKVIGDNNIVEITNNVKKCFNSSSNIFRPDPNSCNETTNKINGNTWYQTDDMNQVMILKKNAIIIANTYDGVNYSDSNASILVTSIDNTPPTNVDFSYIVRNNTITLVANGIDLNSGIYGYQFYLDGIGWTDIKTSNIYTFSPVLLNHTYKAKVRAINNTYDGKNLNKKSYADSKEKEIKTGDKPAVKCSTDTNGWAESKKYTCKFPEGDYVHEYIMYTEKDILDITNDDNWMIYPSSNDFYIEFDTEERGYLLARVTDGINYIDSYSTTVEQIDRTAPTCIWSGESTEWRKSANIVLSCEDKLSNGQDGSGCAITGKNWKYPKENSSGEIIAEEFSTVDLSYTIKDNVGHKTVCSKNANVYVDTLGPSCSWSGESTEWRKSASIKADCYDNGSGCTSDNAHVFDYVNNGSTSIKETDLSYPFKDNVGNSTICYRKSAKVYVDNIKPTCEYSGESTTWRKEATISVTCKENDEKKESGCDTNSLGWSERITKTRKELKHPYTVKDKAGNENVCKPKYNVYVDTDYPKIDNTKMSISGTTVTVTFDASDTSSGIKSRTCLWTSSDDTKFAKASSKSTTTNQCVFTGISDASKYIFAIKAEDNVGNATTVGINGLDIKFNTTSEGICTSSKSTSISYSTGSSENATKYFMVTKSGVTSDVGVYKCGNGSKPGTCSNTAETELTPQYWYKALQSPDLEISSEGTSIIATIFTDGNQAISKSLTVNKIDTTPPTITTTIYKYANKTKGDLIAGPLTSTKAWDSYIINRSWANYGYYFDIKISDTGCGSDSLTKNWNWNNSGNTSTSSGMEPTNKSTFSNNNYTQTLTANGIRTAEVVVTDGVGNTTRYGFSGYVDTDAPSKPTIKAVVQNTTTAYTGESWTNKNISITASSSDTASGVAKIQYTYNYVNSQTVWKDDFGTLTKSGNTASVTGTWNTTTNGRLLVRAIDNLGNVSEISGFSLKIDKGKPTVPTSTTITTSAVPYKSYQNDKAIWSNVKLVWTSFKATDGSNESGIARYEYSTKCTGSKSGNLDSEYIYPLNGSSMNTHYCIRSVDNAGNTSAWSDPYYFRIDLVDPTVTSLTQAENSEGKIVLTGKAKDSESGLVAYAFTKNKTTPDDKTWETFTTSTNIAKTKVDPSDGTWYFHVKDKAGNTSSKAITVKNKKLTYNNTATSGSIRTLCANSNCSNATTISINNNNPTASCSKSYVLLQAYIANAHHYLVASTSSKSCASLGNTAGDSVSPIKSGLADACYSGFPSEAKSNGIFQITYGKSQGYKCIKACFDSNCTSSTPWTLVSVS